LAISLNSQKLFTFSSLNLSDAVPSEFSVVMVLAHGPQQKGHAVTLSPLILLGWGGKWKEKGKNLVGRDKSSLTEQ